MTWFEKIKGMDESELAEFITGCGEYNGFDDMACRACPFRSPRPDTDEIADCKAEDLHNGCRGAIFAQLMREVDGGEST